MGWALAAFAHERAKDTRIEPTQISQIYEKALAHLLPRYALQDQPPLHARSQFA